MTNVNCHIHTPYSFSCFDSVEQAVTLAKNEGIGVLGINDFNTVEGFNEFTTACETQRIYPLYNIEFIALDRDDKAAGRRWNDPKNPGVIYFCGKALTAPVSFGNDSRNILSSVWKATQDQIWQVVLKVNEHFTAVNIPVVLDYNKIRSAWCKYTVRERHVAKAIYHEMLAHYGLSDGLVAAYCQLFSADKLSVDIDNAIALQNEIRNRLLKAGAPCFVEEKPEAFLPLQDIIRLVLDGGGIPCYPVLADDSIPLSEYESDVHKLADTLLAQNIHMVEFIPVRNTFDHLKTYVRAFHERGFVVVFGTEHNSPECTPFAPAARGNVAFDDELNQISYRGACVLAAHQERHRNKSMGFVNACGQRIVSPKDLDEFFRIGDRAIKERNNQ